MSLDRYAATARIARQLKDAERKTDEALIALTELTATLLRARLSTDVAPHTGQTAIMRLIKAQGSFVDGGNNIFRVHDVMSSIGREMGVLDEPNSTPSFAAVDPDEIQRAA